MRTARSRGSWSALLLVSDDSVSATDLAKATGAAPGDVASALAELSAEYADANRGFQLREVAGGWRLFTHPAFHDQVADYVLSWDQRRLSQAALETLAVIAYHQPVSREGVRAIRGVNSDGVIASLREKGLVREVGHDAEHGQAVLFGTTRAFLERFGLRGICDLPPLEDFAPDEQSKQFIRERLSGRSLESTLEEWPRTISTTSVTSWATMRVPRMARLLEDAPGPEDTMDGDADDESIPYARTGSTPCALQRFLARAGVASRRGAERLMTAGRVRVNGEVVTELGSKVDPMSDVVSVDGIECHMLERPCYLMLYKPSGYVTTMSDPQGRHTVAELVPTDRFPGLFPVGRLDMDTTGLLLFTTNGNVGQELLHPSRHVEKHYVALGLWHAFGARP